MCKVKEDGGVAEGDGKAGGLIPRVFGNIQKIMLFDVHGLAVDGGGEIPLPDKDKPVVGLEGGGVLPCASHPLDIDTVDIPDGNVGFRIFR